jgi:predicted DNA-binding transcriptional regulator AlpA
MKPIMRIKDVSEKTGIPEGTLRYWRYRGEGPKSFRLGRKTVAYYEDDVDAWLEQRYERTARGGEGEL